MKYVLVLADGMADEPLEEFGGKTPMEIANKPYMDKLAAIGEVGLAHTVPEGFSPGSDVANLAVLGYDPKQFYTGRSPLEAVSIGAKMLDDDVCFRVNFVTLTDEEDYWNKTIIDHSAGEITTKESRELIESIMEAFADETKIFYKGVSYRHALIWHEGSMKIELTPPHNILGQKITDYMPKGINGEIIAKMQEKSYDILMNHPINKDRIKRGLNPANSIWIWGEGTRPSLPNFYETFGFKGAMISAVDLLKGIALSAGMKSIDVENATGNIDTNFEGKTKAALDTLKEGTDFVYVHLEAPDECGHQGNAKEKIRSIELIDEKVVGPIYEELTKQGIDFKIAVLPDHPTPVKYRTHTSNPVPYLIYSSKVQMKRAHVFTEKGALETKINMPQGYKFMKYFLSTM